MIECQTHSFIALIWEHVVVVVVFVVGVVVGVVVVVGVIWYHMLSEKKHSHNPPCSI